MRILKAACIALALLALSSSPVAAAEVDRCGTITEGFIGDLPSGGFISIDGDKYLVGGVGGTGNIALPPPEQVKVGARICFKGTVEPVGARTFDVKSGVFTLVPASLPSTTTTRDHTAAPLTVIVVALFAILVGLRLRSRGVTGPHR